MEDVYRPGKYFSNKYGINISTLRNWADSGSIRHFRVGPKDGRRRYHVGDVLSKFNVPREQKRLHVLYARVSSIKQKEDLGRQIEQLKQLYPNHDRVISDIGSGVNFKRRGMQTLLELVCDGLVEKITILYKDRLARIGYEIFEQICTKFGTVITVHNESEKDQDGEHDDLVAIITCFVASHHGKRASINRKRKHREIERESEEKAKT